MIAFADAGITTFDCADIYTGVEDMIGEFRQRYRMLRGEAALDGIRVHTKFVPDLDMLPRITRSYVEGVIDRSLQRLKMERLDLVQFHWWDYAVPGYLDAAGHLADLRRAGKIDRIGATNFDTAHMLGLVDSGVPLVSMQVQYSLLDARPARQMVAAATKHGVSLLCYGTVAGGFLSDRWLGAARAGSRLREPLADQIQAGHRRFRRLGTFPEAAEDAAAHRRPPRQRHRHGGERRDAASGRPSPASSSARATARIWPRTSQYRASRSRDEDHAEIDAVLALGQRSRRRRVRVGARPQRPPWLDHEIQSQQGSSLTAAREWSRTMLLEDA